jgi:hypothetical protein
MMGRASHGMYMSLSDLKAPSTPNMVLSTSRYSEASLSFLILT